MILKKKSAKKSSSQQICDKNVTCQLEFSGLEELGQVAADVTSCQIMDKTIICLHFATFFVLHVNKKILSPTDWQLKIKWNCRLKIQNRFRHSKVIAENMKLSSFLLYLSQ